MANFCTNCGNKIRKEDNFCTNCGVKLKEESNICINCGAKLEKVDNFCTNCGTKIDKSDIKRDKPTFESILESIEKNRVAKEKEEEKVIIKKERKIYSEKIEKNEPVHGGYCNLNCRHCYEEFLDSGGGIVGDFDSEGYYEYYCHLGHYVSFGSFCKDYE